MREEQAVGVREQNDPSAAAPDELEIDLTAPAEGAVGDVQAAALAGDEAASAVASPAGDEAASEVASPVADEQAPEVASLAGDLDELVEKAAQRDEYLALAQRTQADFENYRKRVARDASAAEIRGLTRLARELLPALDNLDRALAASADADGALVEGLRLVQRELLGALERTGIESYGVAGEQFDPGLHEAVAQQPFEGRERGGIVEVYQSGYRLGGGVIRPARVLVAG
jgi:molecular chaperone GrpE